MKFGLLFIFLQSLIFIQSLFLVLTQFPSMRQPAKLFILLIALWSLFSLMMSLYHYIKEEKD